MKNTEQYNSKESLEILSLQRKIRRALQFFIVVMALMLTSLVVPKKASAQGGYVSFQVFYDNLSPYGYWVDNATYGYVWVPRVGRGFTPYGSNGYWVFTQDGWTWFSNYSWGWAPFHYGRWFYDSYYGWLWVPDYEWGPGWVCWRRSEGYYGWAPIEPGISIDIAYGNGYRVPYNRWRFVRDRDFGRSNIYNYYVSSNSYTTIINRSTVINNIHVDNGRNSRFNAGPDRADAEKRAGRTFNPLAIRESNRPTQSLGKEGLQLYRPQLQRNVSAERKPAPAKIMAWRKNEALPPPRNVQSAKPPVVQQKNNQQPIRQLPEQQKRIDQPIKQPPVEQRRNDQPIKQPLPQERRNDQPIKQPPGQQRRNDQPVRQNPVQPQHNDQPIKQPLPQQRRNDQPVRQNPVQQQRNDQPVNQPPVQQKRNEQPIRQLPPQQKSNDQQGKQPPGQQRRNDQPGRLPPGQQKKNDQQGKQPPVKQKQEQPPKKDGGG